MLREETCLTRCGGGSSRRRRPGVWCYPCARNAPWRRGHEHRRGANMNNKDHTALNARHGIAGVVLFLFGFGGLFLVEVTNARANAVIAVQGAQLLSYARHDEPPVVWMSPHAKYSAGISVRGGVPVCWPWFGPHASEPSVPAHCFARTLPWEVVMTASTGEATQLVFRFVPDASMRVWWPQASALECRITVGDALEMELVTHNRSDEAMTLTEALHTYFGVSDVRAINVMGLVGVVFLVLVVGGRRLRFCGGVSFFGVC